MIDPEQLKQQLIQLFASQRLAVLSTQHQGQPYASLIAFAASDDLKELIFATPRSTRKFAYLQACPKVALLIDSRSNQEADIHQAIAVTALGTAVEVPSEDVSLVLEHFIARHPLLDEFARSESTAVIRVIVETYYVVSRFQEVVELHINQ
jgi:nitroimidazol reductase NimA-like FMN-containing flavoprotein (pyridoxamine 5'-phosphate oxidase superfamily)